MEEGRWRRKEGRRKKKGNEEMKMEGNTFASISAKIYFVISMRVSRNDYPLDGA
jgi:hypothetical protein